MAQKTVVTVVCDLPHDGEVEGTESEKMGVFADHARRATAGGRRRKPRTGPGRERSSEIREWARQRGHKVSERGRIPGNIIAEYEAAH